MMPVRPITIVLATLIAGTFAQNDTPPPPLPPPTPGEGIRITFLPPPLEGTVSLGLYDGTGKLVRVLHKEATKKDFTVGLNGFITHWDGKNDGGEALAPGKYRARGWMVGDLGVEGVAYHGNDWMKADDSPRVTRIVGVKNVGRDEIHIWQEHVRGEQLEFSWSFKKEGVEPPKVEALAFVDDGKLIVRKPGTGANEIKLGEGERAVATVVGFSENIWVIVEKGDVSEIRAYSATGEFLRRLTYAPGEPRPKQIAASLWSELILVVEEGNGEQRLRALALGPGPAGEKPAGEKPAGEKPAEPAEPAKSVWKIVYQKRIFASGKFEEIAGKLGRPEPFKPEAELKLTAKLNPLATDGAKAELAIKIGTDATGAVLHSTDGLPLLHLSDTPGLKWAVMAREGEKITVFQGDGALVEEFKVTKPDNFMPFDAGDYEIPDPTAPKPKKEEE